jgi:hypothetical protein
MQLAAGTAVVPRAHSVIHLSRAIFLERKQLPVLQTFRFTPLLAGPDPLLAANCFNRASESCYGNPDSIPPFIIELSKP